MLYQNPDLACEALVSAHRARSIVSATMRSQAAFWMWRAQEFSYIFVFPKIVGFPPKSSILIGFSIKNPSILGYLNFGNPHISMIQLKQIAHQNCSKLWQEQLFNIPGAHSGQTPTSHAWTAAACTAADAPAAVATTWNHVAGKHLNENCWEVKLTMINPSAMRIVYFLTKLLFTVESGPEMNPYEASHDSNPLQSSSWDLRITSKRFQGQISPHLLHKRHSSMQCSRLSQTIQRNEPWTPGKSQSKRSVSNMHTNMLKVLILRHFPTHVKNPSLLHSDFIRFRPLPSFSPMM